MNWELLLQVTLPLIAGMGWMWKQLNQRMDRMEDKLSDRIDCLGEKVDDVRDRVGRLEGAFYERGYWESRKAGGDKT